MIMPLFSIMVSSRMKYLSISSSVEFSLTMHAEEGFHRAIKKPAPVYLGACKETIELVLDSFDEWRKLMME